MFWKEDDKYCFVTFSLGKMQNGVKNKDTFHMKL